jgi:hypothetical protein
MAASSAALAIGFASHSSGEHRSRLLVATLVLGVLALALLLKVSFARWAAVGGNILAAMLALSDLASDPQVAKVFFFMGFHAGLMLLLVGRPGVPRVVIGVLLAAPLVGLEVMLAFAR